jgi:hypothetical protein
MFCQTKIRGVIAILKNANILVTKDASRNPEGEAAQLILIRILQEQVNEIAKEVIEETFGDQVKPWPSLPSLNRPLQSESLEYNISFDIVTETVMSLANAVAVEVYTEARMIASTPRGLAIEK